MVRLKTTRKVLQIKTNYNKWLDEIKKCWESKRLDILSTILSENLQYFESPFGPPLTDKKQIVEQWKKDLKRQEKIKIQPYDFIFQL